MAASMDVDVDVLNAVRQRYDQLTHSQKRIAEAIVEDPEFVAFATVDKLADRLSVAPSTVVRFAYRIGLNGYPDLQERVRQIVRGQLRGAPSEASDHTATAHLDDAGHGASLARDMQNLRQTVDSLDPDRLTAAVSMLADARQIFVCGGHASGTLAAYTALILERVRGRVQLIEDQGGRHIPALLEAGPEDTMLVIGFAPYSAQTIQVLDAARSRSVRLIGITDTPISPVGQRVDVVLPARVSGVGVQNSLVAPLAILNVLLNSTTSALPDSVARYDSVIRSMNEWGLFVLSGQDGDAG